MTIRLIPTIGQQNNTVLTETVKSLRKGSVYPQAAEIILYTGWPQVRDYDGRVHSSDLTAFGQDNGIKLIKFSLSSNLVEVKRDAQSILQAAATTEALMSKSLKLKRRRKLIFQVIPILYAPNLDGHRVDDGEVEFADNEAELFRLLKESDESLSPEQRDEAQAIIEGAKALGQLAEVEEDRILLPIAQAYRDLEAVIYNFDARQRSVALTGIKGPQRIRGLAGTGKTVILAMKAALVDNT